jgi:hypothetical protein
LNFIASEPVYTDIRLAVNDVDAYGVVIHFFYYNINSAQYVQHSECEKRSENKDPRIKLLERLKIQLSGYVYVGDRFKDGRPPYPIMCSSARNMA